MHLLQISLVLLLIQAQSVLSRHAGHKRYMPYVPDSTFKGAEEPEFSTAITTDSTVVIVENVLNRFVVDVPEGAQTRIWSASGSCQDVNVTLTDADGALLDFCSSGRVMHFRGDSTRYTLTVQSDYSFPIGIRFRRTILSCGDIISINDGHYLNKPVFLVFPKDHSMNKCSLELPGEIHVQMRRTDSNQDKLMAVVGVHTDQKENQYRSAENLKKDQTVSRYIFCQNGGSLQLWNVHSPQKDHSVEVVLKRLTEEEKRQIDGVKSLSPCEGVRTPYAEEST